MDSYDDKIFYAILKLSEAMALLKEIIHDREGEPLPSDNFMDRRIDEVDFGEGSSRVRYLCSEVRRFENGEWVSKPIETIRDMVSFCEADFLRIPNVGRVTMNKVKAVLAAHGLKLKPWEQA